MPTYSGYDTVERDGLEIDVFVSVEWSHGQDERSLGCAWHCDDVSAETVPPNTPGPIELTRAEFDRFKEKFSPCR